MTSTDPTLTTPTAVPGTGRGTRPQWGRATASMLGVHGVVGAWFWALAVVAVVVATLLVDHFTTVRVSVMQFAIYATLWFPFSIAVAIAVVLTTCVANGMTRRSFIRGALASSFVAALGHGLVMALLLIVEGWIYGALGWAHGAMGTDDDGIVDGIWESGLLAPWAVIALMVLAGLVSGLAVGAGYHRFGGLRGTLLLPFALLPVLGAQVLVDLGRPDSVGNLAGLGGWVYLIVGGATLVIAGYFAAVVRRTPIGGVVA
ncbi:hypothetical protein ACPYO6_00585 [Georgenia sp. Z1344]|uniref:hypothetical protein n=1 Tax=Georgenia sp. Z1344 TaxID=3416706 RepID=UPI003CECD974